MRIVVYKKNLLMPLFFLLSIIVCIFIIPKEYSNGFILYMGVFSAAIVFIYVAHKITSYKISVILFFVGLFIMASLMAFRAQTAIDDWQYARKFVSVGTQSFWQYFIQGENEKGYVVFTYILYHITDGNYNLAQAITTFLNFSLWGVAIWQYRESCNIVAFSLFLWTHYYCLIMSAGLVRLFIAVPIVLLSIRFLWGNNWKKYLLGIIIASLFHVSALIMLIFLLFYIKNGFFYNHWIIFSIGAVILVPIIFLLISRFLVPLLGTRYSSYSIVGTFRFSWADLDVLPIWIIGAYHLRYVSPKYKKRYIIAMILVMLSIVFSIFSSVVGLGRLGFYSNLGILIIASEIFENKDNSFSSVIMPYILLIYGFFYMMHTGFLNDGVVQYLIPYNSFFQ